MPTTAGASARPAGHAPPVVASAAEARQAQVQAQVQVHVTAPALQRFGALRAHLAELTEAALRNTASTRATLQLHVGGVGLQVRRRRTRLRNHK